jgi:DUF4097 and DUF4098 domain-containing protein YvlB
MSTASPTPNPGHRPRSLFGPIVLVAIGALFLAGNFGWIHWSNFGPLFARYWPLLLIFWGLVKLGEYIWARQRGLPAPGIGAGGVVFMVFFILIGITATKAAGVNWRALGVEVDDVNFEPFGFFGSNHEFSENFAQEMKPGEQVRVLEVHGNISVSPSADNQIHAFVHKYVRASSDDEAGKTNEATHPKLVHQGDLWLLDLTSGGYSQGRFDLDLQIPAASPISLMTRHGDLTVSQRTADVILESLHGDVKAEDIKGSATVRMRHGDATIKNVTGDLIADGYISDISVSDVKGTVTLTGTYVGSIQLSHIDKQLRFNSTRTDLQIARLQGDLTMDRGDLHVTSATGPLKLDAQTKDVHLEEVTGDIRIENRRGSVELRTSAPLGSVEISNVRGDIDISVPDKSAFQVDAASDNGEIQNDFDLTVDNKGRNVTAKGTVGKGGPMIRLKTNRGTIQIRKQ